MWHHFGMNKVHETFNFHFFPGAISMSILLLILAVPSEKPHLKPFSESYVYFALPIEVQSCIMSFMFLIVFASNFFC